MSGDRYPRSLIEPLLVKAALPESYRIMPRRYFGAPLGTSVADSRFASRDAGYTLLYAAPEFATAFIETVVRDRLVGRRGRELALRELTERIWVRVESSSGGFRPVARDIEFEDHGMVNHAIDGRGGGHRILEDLIPLREDQVAGDQDAPETGHVALQWMSHPARIAT